MHTKQSSRLLVLCLAMIPLAATGDTYKCILKDGKIRYTNQMSYEKGVTCEQMFVRKPSVSQDEPVAEPKPEAKSATEPTDEGVSVPDVAASEAPVPPQKTQADKDLEAKRKKAEEAKKKADQAAEDKKAADKKLAEQKAKEEKERNCAAAKANLATYKAGRVRKVDDKGEYYFVDEAGIKEGLAQAEKDLAENCK